MNVCYDWLLAVLFAGCEVRGARYEVRGARALRLQSASTIGFKQLFSVLSVDDRNKLQVPGIY